jgi:phosphohistidine swiveling domain-containing protein
VDETIPVLVQHYRTLASEHSPKPSLITLKNKPMQITLRFLFVLFLFSSAAFIQPANAAKTIIPVKEKKEIVKKIDAPQTNKLAKLSAILTVSGTLISFLPVIGIAGPFLVVGGFVFAFRALKQIRRTEEKGKELAVASLIVSGLSILGGIIGIAILLSAFN